MGRRKSARGVVSSALRGWVTGVPPSTRNRYVAIGGEAEALHDALGERWRPDLDLEGAVRCAVSSLSVVAGREIPAEDLEVSGLDRTRPRRTFFRLDTDVVADLLAD